MTDRTAYLSYGPEVEQQQPHEDEDVQALRETFAKIRIMAFEKTRHAVRDAHAKSHGILAGTLRVHDGLPVELAQGLFARPAEHPVIVRFSTAPGDIVSDGIGSAFGMAIKVLEVDGEKVLPGDTQPRTQDFLLVNHPTISSGDVHTYRRDQAVLLQTSKAPEGVQVAATTVLRGAADVLRSVGIDRTGGPAGQAKPHVHLLGETYWSQGALRHGDHVAKVSAAPVSENLTALTGEHVSIREPSAYRDLTSAFFAEGRGVWELRVQLATDLETTPVEDASVRWPEDVTPYRTVATLTLEPQDSFSPARRVYGDDELSFNPWHCLVEHRPLGSIQRVRRPVYDDSTSYRSDTNARALNEPETLDDLPD
ncbi:catalase family protein [Rathayibacter sp. VKM Ac-2928]|uniref:catalase family protein n=1 Tax=Rathayibacter sp. VKM Ac-2928 TaxID=2929479 RepID=UPI001FB2AC56|nr:catalase family protein [Rathayibacter sp. VKM Ac-2928]MCJ1685361.1 catalase family protein [Rathayibacter sp. VKM Ac-2928]